MPHMGLVSIEWAAPQWRPVVEARRCGAVGVSGGLYGPAVLRLG